MADLILLTVAAGLTVTLPNWLWQSSFVEEKTSLTSLQGHYGKSSSNPSIIRRITVEGLVSTPWWQRSGFKTSSLIWGSSVTISLGLSLILLALSILEVVPSSWFLVLSSSSSKDSAPGSFTLAGAYRILLWAMTIHILIILPSSIAMQIARQTGLEEILTKCSCRPTWLFSNCGDLDSSNRRSSLPLPASTPSKSKLRHFDARKKRSILLLMLSVIKNALIILVQSFCCVLQWALGGLLCPNRRSRRSPSTSAPNSASLPTHSIQESSHGGRACMSRILGCCSPRFLFLLLRFSAMAITMILLQWMAPLFIDLQVPMAVAKAASSVVDDGADDHVVAAAAAAAIASLARSTATTSLWWAPWTWWHGDLLARAVSWLCAVGMIISALLNGFGSVSMPHACLAGWYLEPVSSDAVARAEAELEQMQTSLQDRRRKDPIMSHGSGSGGLGDMSHLLISNSATPTTASTTNQSSAWSWNMGIAGSTTTKRNSFITMGEGLAQRKRQLQTEIDFLETLVQELQQDVMEMREARHVAEQARTPMGRIRSWIGILFSIILLVRIVAAWMSISSMLYASTTTLSIDGRLHHDAMQRHHEDIVAPTSKVDPVTVALMWLLGHHVVSAHDYNAFAQFTSLVLTAFLSYSQIKAFIRTVSVIHRRLNKLYSRYCCSCVFDAGGTTAWSHQSAASNSVTLDENSTAAGVVDALQGPKQHSQRLSDMLAPIIAALMGCYFVACIVLTKLMLPYKYRAQWVAALASPSTPAAASLRDLFVVRNTAVNAVFALSALVSFSILGLLLGIQRQNTYRYQQQASSAPASIGGGLAAATSTTMTIRAPESGNWDNNNSISSLSTSATCHLEP